jgi:hypothetical protein
MKAAIGVLALLIACLLAGDCLAQSDDRFQRVDGEYGRNIIGTLAANDTGQASSNNSSDNNGTLWSWGTIPKGSMMVNGTPTNDPFINPGAIENPENSYVQVGVDAFTGMAIYSYRPAYGAATKYFYVDPYTRLPVYVDWKDVVTDTYSISSSGSEGYTLPAAFR